MVPSSSLCLSPSLLFLSECARGGWGEQGESDQSGELGLEPGGWGTPASPCNPTPLADREPHFLSRGRTEDSREKPGAEEAATARAQVPTPQVASWGERGVGWSGCHRRAGGEGAGGELLKAGVQ